MTIAETMLAELDHEMAGTRRMLAAIPHDRASFRPHPRSVSMVELASHLASIPTWITRAIETGEFDISPPGAPHARPRQLPMAQVLETFDANVRSARATLAAADDERMRQTWQLKKNGAVVATLPRAHVVRSFALSHMIHHRGQLSVYLRLVDALVPGVYGPTADDPL